MKNVKKLVNDNVEQLFLAALRRSYTANFLLELFKYVSPKLYAVWLFRKGDIAKSYAILNGRNNKGLFKKCEDRSRYILYKLERPAPDYQARATEPFNKNILFAVHSIGNHYANGYARRTALISESLTQMGFNLSGMTRPGYPWDLSKTVNLPRNMNSSFGQVDYTHFFDEHMLISDAEDKYIDVYSKLLAQHAKKKQCSVIHAHSSYINGISASIAAKELGILSVYEMRGLWHLSRAVKEPLFEYSDHYRYLDKMEIEAAYLCDKVVTLNNTLREWLISHGVEAGKIDVVPNGVNMLPSASYIKKRNVFTIGFVGSITEYEGIEDVIDAIRLLAHEGITVAFEIYGDGDYRKTVEKRVKNLNLSQQVLFKGRIPKEQLPNVYAMLDGIVVTRRALEVTKLVTPIKLVEAMMMAKPCIVSDLPALREVVEPNRTSLVVKPDSPSEIANAIRHLIENPEQCMEMAKKAQCDAMTRFNWQNSVHIYSSVYGA
jgi:glycosyltransferase involved in cell wall biosynthesis